MSVDISPVTLSGHRLRAARIVWSAVALTAAAMLVMGLFNFWTVAQHVCHFGAADCSSDGLLTRANFRQLADMGLSPEFYATYAVVGYAVSALVWCLVGATIFSFSLTETGDTLSLSYAVLVQNTVLIAVMAFIPLSIGIAMLRSRLFDVDVIINRALVYATLTAMLAAVYFGGVVAIQYAFRVLTGQESSIAVVVSTLAIAALFVPLRHRVQEAVDRRFYRQKYDAAKTLEDFAARLREETDLEALGDGLVGVVRETVRPARVSLWLRPQDGDRDGGT